MSYEGLGGMGAVLTGGGSCSQVKGGRTRWFGSPETPTKQGCVATGQVQVAGSRTVPVQMSQWCCPPEPAVPSGACRAQERAAWIPVPTGTVRDVLLREGSHSAGMRQMVGTVERELWCMAPVISTPLQLPPTPAPPTQRPPVAPSQLPQAPLSASCVQYLQGLSRAQVQSLAARWQSYEQAVTAWRTQQVPESRRWEMGARGPIPTFQGTTTERACGRHAAQWLERMPERPWYAHPAVMVVGAVIGGVTLYSWVTRRPVVPKAGPPLVGGSR